MSFGDRVVLYGLITSVVVALSSVVAGGVADSACESDPEASDCDLGIFFAIEGGLVALLVCLFVILVTEAIARRSR